MNLRHLRNFWTVARMGGVARAAERLALTPQTISGQLRQLEEDLGAVLFRQPLAHHGAASHRLII